ncbi:MAG TPA: GFA family protein [Woeseiaceae bacterium]|nr:GFA family protein [Woeseiaceae bacterium]
MSNGTFSGSCLCGTVRYEATGEVTRFYHCHCSRCRKATGTGHASNLFLEGTLRWLSGEDQVASYKPPEAKRFTNAFCRQCGGRVPRFSPEARFVMIPAGSLDVDPGTLPQARIFTGSRTGWSCSAAALPEFEEYPG